ncbi:MAG: glycosyltransferase family 4 protein [Thermoplasmatales archaeon]|nr:glycosyltransferase family 4 protein [Thermoplasmatales archaeon]
MMRVGLLTFQSSKYIKYVGVERYENSLISGLKNYDIDIEKVAINKKEIGIHPIPNRVWVLVLQYFSKKPDGYDLFHASSQFTATKYADVVTAHDVIGLKDIPEIKETISVFEKGLWLSCLPLIRRAKRIIAISETTKNDLINIAKIRENKIRVIYRDVDEKFYPVKDKDFKEKLSNSLLFVGELRIYKNAQLVLRAMKILKEKYEEEYKFIIIGKESKASLKWWNKYSEFISKNNLNVEWLKEIDDELLRKYYSNVEIFVWPSLYEGLGLPPLEAMACGTNVVCLDNEINREILQDKAFYSFNNSEDFAKAIRKAIENKKPEKELISYAKKFNWEKSAKEAKEVYEEVA